MSHVRAADRARSRPRLTLDLVDLDQARWHAGHGMVRIDVLDALRHVPGV